MQNRESIFILGVGHNTIVCIDLAESCGYSVAGLYHYNSDMYGQKIFGHEVLGCSEELFLKESLLGIKFLVSIGDNILRSKTAKRIRQMGGETPVLIHPSATVSRYADLSLGCVVHANAVVQPDVTIGEDSVVSFSASVTHSSSIGNGNYIAGAAIVGAYVTTEDLVLIGMNSTIVSSKVDRIGYRAVVGAGSVVTKNVEQYNVVSGNPARVVKTVDNSMVSF